MKQKSSQSRHSFNPQNLRFPFRIKNPQSFYTKDTTVLNENTKKSLLFQFFCDSRLDYSKPIELETTYILNWTRQLKLPLQIRLVR